MKAALLAVACIAASSALCGCDPYLGSCSWAIPEAGRSVQVVGKRVPIAGECERLRCTAPGDFKLRRDRYTLEFWNGDSLVPTTVCPLRELKVANVFSPFFHATLASH